MPAVDEDGASVGAVGTVGAGEGEDEVEVEGKKSWEGGVGGNASVPACEAAAAVGDGGTGGAAAAGSSITGSAKATGSAGAS